MSRIRLDRMLVVDLELTCWEGVPPAGEESEVIEIGVAEVMLGVEPALGRARSWFVRPTRSKVSAHCEALTGISADHLRRQGRPLREVVGSIRKEFGGAGKAWAAWGRDDQALSAECDRAGVEMPFSGEFLNLGLLYAIMTGASRPVGLSEALAEMGLPFDGRAHSGLDDARNTAALLMAMGGRLRRRQGAPD